MHWKIKMIGFDMAANCPQLNRGEKWGGERALESLSDPHQVSYNYTYNCVYVQIHCNSSFWTEANYKLF